MKYLVIKGVYKVWLREEVVGKEWRFQVVDGNGNELMIEVDGRVVSKALGLVKKEREREATRGEEVE